MVYCVRKLHCKKFPSEVKMFRTYTNYNPQKFCNDLNDVNWESNIDVVAGSQAEDLTYVDQLWISFKNSFLAVANQHAPIIEKKIRGIQTPWMTGHIKYVMHQRDYYLNKAKKSELQEHWKMYRSLRNQVTLLIRKAKRNYITRNLLMITVITQKISGRQ